MKNAACEIFLLTIVSRCKTDWKQFDRVCVCGCGMGERGGGGGGQEDKNLSCQSFRQVDSSIRQ